MKEHLYSRVFCWHYITGTTQFNVILDHVFKLKIKMRMTSRLELLCKQMEDSSLLSKTHAFRKSLLNELKHVPLINAWINRLFT